jgi:hypothetical protein
MDLVFKELREAIEMFEERLGRFGRLLTGTVFVLGMLALGAFAINIIWTYGSPPFLALVSLIGQFIGGIAVLLGTSFTRAVVAIGGVLLVCGILAGLFVGLVEIAIEYAKIVVHRTIEPLRKKYIRPSSH